VIKNDDENDDELVEIGDTSASEEVEQFLVSVTWLGPELDMDWIHPWIGLDWIGLD